jgi:hypothetical protein
MLMTDAKSARRDPPSPSASVLPNIPRVFFEALTISRMYDAVQTKVVSDPKIATYDSAKFRLPNRAGPRYLAIHTPTNNPTPMRTTRSAMSQLVLPRILRNPGVRLVSNYGCFPRSHPIAILTLRLLSSEAGVDLSGCGSAEGFDNRLNRA